MAIIKCKMCGGDIELSADKTYGTCDSCGSTMTFPKVDDEHRANLFNRANHFRRQNEFDKAISAYERILDENNADAEAHWGVVLSRFGIEYVEDPVSHERIPTCHRVQAVSILTDADYLAACEYAPDSYSRSLYEAEAKRIADIQRGILAISSQEKPYDVFICYKESTEGGSRTKDSTFAQDIYYQLKQEGFNVFFARITLEDKLGQQYEPYIFAALNSAKVMLVVGTKPEYFNAVWVKNEWSRYLALMKQDRSRLLIPCYRDMDAYDLPDELSTLQSQDMSKIGFMQDLIRGVTKVLGSSKPQQEASVTSAAPVNAAAPLLRRAFMFLEDGDWAKADEFCEQVLNLEPENAEAYLGKLMARLKVGKRDQLKNCAVPFDNEADYAKALRFGDTKLKVELQDYIQHINDRNEQARLEGLYQSACAHMKQARSEIDYKNAARGFEVISHYKDAAEQADVCRKKAEVERLKQERAAEQARIKAAEEARERKRFITILAIVAVVAVAAFFVVIKVIIPNQKYNAAVELMNEGKYADAYDAFIVLNGYRDSATKADSILYKALAEKTAVAKVGDYITFGTYEQDGNTWNGTEPIEWRVIAKENNRLLVISRYALDTKPYNETNTDVTWETCTLRKWLNNDFLNAAFNSKEKSIILTVEVSPDKNPSYSTNPGKVTQDKVFLLSIPEVNKYFTTDRARQCKPTSYAKKQGASNHDDIFCAWWLRSPGATRQRNAAEVSTNGRVIEYGDSVNYPAITIRPALWIELAE